jgi:hypothetical protein
MSTFEQDLQSFDTAQEKIINRVRRMFQDIQEAGVERIDFMTDLGLDFPGSLLADSFDVTADSSGLLVNREKVANTGKPSDTMLEICELQFCFPPIAHDIPMKLLTMPEAEFKSLIARLGKKRKAKLAAEDKARAKAEAKKKKEAKARRYKQYLELSKEFGGNTNDTEKTANETARNQARKAKAKL